MNNSHATNSTTQLPTAQEQIGGENKNCCSRLGQERELDQFCWMDVQIVVAGCGHVGVKENLVESPGSQKAAFFFVHPFSKNCYDCQRPLFEQLSPSAGVGGESY